ncbi:aminotransferase class IV [Halalkalirubrum salinum]|uniref:aminotransferase class IV n=1 Tax=Halalkalirubrum salinum TaxID=2563889 RepID=UPI0010FADD97|nr:aminotransferase class IV [Halalkalirubrum salinum]
MSEDGHSDELQYHVNGEIVPAAEATVSVRDRGFMYGDGAFETMRAYGGSIFAWEAHADRLAETCSILGVDHGLDRSELKARIDKTLAANNLSEAYVKLSVTRGVQPGKLTPDPVVDPTVVVYVSPLDRGGREGSSVWDGPATIQTVKTKRIPDQAVPARAKTHNYLNGILARLELRVSDADEALMLDTNGNVAEGATSNLFFVDDRALKTPSLDGPILPGITRQTVIELAESEGIPVETGRYRPDDIRSADEVFVTNSTWELRPVDRVDGIAIDPETDGPGPVTKLLSALFDDRIEREYYGDESASKSDAR